MISKYPVLAAAVMAGLALPMAAAPAFAQDQQAVRDALNRAQSNAGHLLHF